MFRVFSFSWHAEGIPQKRSEMREVPSVIKKWFLSMPSIPNRVKPVMFVIFSFRFYWDLHWSNLHDFNFLTALKLGVSLNLNLPADTYIIATEINIDLEFGEELSSVIAQRYPEILKNVNCLISRILK